MGRVAISRQQRYALYQRGRSSGTGGGGPANAVVQSIAPFSRTNTMFDTNMMKHQSTRQYAEQLPEWAGVPVTTKTWPTGGLAGMTESNGVVYIDTNVCIGDGPGNTLVGWAFPGKAVRFTGAGTALRGANNLSITITEAQIPLAAMAADQDSWLMVEPTGVMSGMAFSDILVQGPATFCDLTGAWLSRYRGCPNGIKIGTVGAQTANLVSGCTFDRIKVVGVAGDGFKWFMRGGRIRDSSVVYLANTPSHAQPYVAGTSYAQYDCVITAGGSLKIRLAAGIASLAPVDDNTTANADWGAPDPHCDALSCYDALALSGVAPQIERIYIDMEGHPNRYMVGVNNVVRHGPNTAVVAFFDPVVYRDVAGRRATNLNSRSVQCFKGSSVTYQVPQFYNCLFTEHQGGKYMINPAVGLEPQWVSVRDYFTLQPAIDSGIAFPAPVYGADASNRAWVPRTGTSNAPAGSVIEMRAVSKDDAGATTSPWQAIFAEDGTPTVVGADGSWFGGIYVQRSMSAYDIEARVQGSAGAALALGGRFKCGLIAFTEEQSLVARYFLSFFNDPTAKSGFTYPNPGQVQIQFLTNRSDDGANGSTPDTGVLAGVFEPDSTNTTDLRHTWAVAAMTDALMKQMDCPVLMMYDTKSGTAMSEIARTAQVSRSFAVSKLLADWLHADAGATVGLFIYTHFREDIGDDGTEWFQEWLLPFVMGTDPATMNAIPGNGTFDSDGLEQITWTVPSVIGGSPVAIQHHYAQIYPEFRTKTAFSIGMVGGVGVNDGGIADPVLQVSPYRTALRSQINNPSAYSAPTSGLLEDTSGLINHPLRFRNRIKRSARAALTRGRVVSHYGPLIWRSDGAWGNPHYAAYPDTALTGIGRDIGMIEAAVCQIVTPLAAAGLTVTPYPAFNEFKFASDMTYVDVRPKGQPVTIRRKMLGLAAKTPSNAFSAEVFGFYQPTASGREYVKDATIVNDAGVAAATGWVRLRPNGGGVWSLNNIPEFSRGGETGIGNPVNRDDNLAYDVPVIAANGMRGGMPVMVRVQRWNEFQRNHPDIKKTPPFVLLQNTDYTQGFVRTASLGTATNMTFEAKLNPFIGSQIILFSHTASGLLISLNAAGLLTVSWNNQSLVQCFNSTTTLPFIQDGEQATLRVTIDISGAGRVDLYKNGAVFSDAAFGAGSTFLTTPIGIRSSYTVSILHNLNSNRQGIAEVEYAWFRREKLAPGDTPTLAIQGGIVANVYGGFDLTGVTAPTFR